VEAQIVAAQLSDSDSSSNNKNIGNNKNAYAAYEYEYKWGGHMVTVGDDDDVSVDGVRLCILNCGHR
jgi:hypothetical protein